MIPPDDDARPTMADLDDGVIWDDEHAAKLRARNGKPYDDAPHPAEVVELDAFRRPAEPARRWRPAIDVVPEILARAHRPWISIAVGGLEIARVRGGGIVTLIGSSGGGKTSLAIGLLLDHSWHRGPAIFLSRELPADEAMARAIGMQCDASWEDVLTGRVQRDLMIGALPPRLIIADREDATIAVLGDMLAEARAKHGGDAPIMVVVDYLQIIESAQREIRAQVADVMARIDAVARVHNAVVIVVSQSARSGARALRRGEATGAETTDLGAESAAIERWASVTLAISAPPPEAEDDLEADAHAGERRIELHIGKQRMGAGDQVRPMLYDGRSGRVRPAGEARPATEVRAERVAAREGRQTVAVGHAIRDLLGRAFAPMSRRDIRGELGGTDATVRAAVAALLADADSGVVEVEPRRYGAYDVWTRDRADAAGRVVRRVEAP